MLRCAMDWYILYLPSTSVPCRVDADNNFFYIAIFECSNKHVILLKIHFTGIRFFINTKVSPSERTIKPFRYILLAKNTT